MVTIPLVTSYVKNGRPPKRRRRVGDQRSAQGPQESQCRKREVTSGAGRTMKIFPSQGRKTFARGKDEMNQNLRAGLTPAPFRLVFPLSFPFRRLDPFVLGLSAP